MSDIKIMLVDDEPPFLEEMKRIITEYGNNCRVIAEAYVGKQALEMLETKAPDIIFSDIRMPVLDGIEFARRLSDLQKDIFVVIISGYASFDYAREAFRADVFDYLLKPIDPELVNNVLDRLIPLIMEKRYEKFESLLKKAMFSDEVITENVSDHNVYCLLLVKVPLMETDDETIKSPETLCIKSNMFHLIKSILRKQEEVWLLSSETCEFIVLMGLSSYREGSVNEICKALKRYFDGLNLPVNIGLSGEVANLKQLRKKYKATEEHFLKHVIIGKSKLMALHNPMKEENDDPSSAPDHAKLKQLIGTANWNGFKSELINIFSIWEERDYPQYIVSRVLKQIAYHFESNAKSTSNILIEKRIDEAVNMSKSYGELLAGYWTIIANKYLSFTDEIKTLKSEDIFTKIDQYIREHLNTPLSLTDISDIFGVSQTFIYNLFKNNTGISFVKYVTDMKIEKAKELLKAPNLNVKDAAKLTGYEDGKYFSRVFKSQTGLSPSEYKKRNEE